MEHFDVSSRKVANSWAHWSANVFTVVMLVAVAVTFIVVMPFFPHFRVKKGGTPLPDHWLLLHCDDGPSVLGPPVHDAAGHDR